MTNEEMLVKIREDRPNQVINEVISFKKIRCGYYNVLVDMQSHFFGTTILHTKQHLPYPFSKYKESDFSKFL